MKEENEYWKRKYEILSSAIQIEADSLRFEKPAQERWCGRTDEVYISFDLDCSQAEETAKRTYKKYDVYKFSHTVGEE